MFTGIIETQGKVIGIRRELGNVHFTLQSFIGSQLKIDQSVSHDGVCLTVIGVENDCHTVTAVDETLRRTALGQWREGDSVNLERCLPMGGRLDGHIVQGHVDTVAECLSIADENGSWRLIFQFPPQYAGMLVDKGSVCLNGVSLTVVNPQDDRFEVAIIPYTWQHTNLGALSPGRQVNIEFDIIGKYVARLLSASGRI